MTLSINSKDAGDPICTHTMYGETEEELLKNARNMALRNMDILKRHGMKKCLRIKKSSRH